MRIGFTGSQSGMTTYQEEQFLVLLEMLKGTELLHGDCIGSDERANELAVEQGGIKFISIYPPLEGKKRAWCFNPLHVRKTLEWQTIDEINVRWHPMEAYLERNKSIVKDCDHLIATPKEMEHTLRSGTWATIRFAWHIKKAITVIPPLGDKL